MNSLKRIGLAWFFVPVVLLASVLSWAGKKQAPPEPVWVESAAQPAPTMGSLFVPTGGMSDLPSDYKAHNVNDLIVIRILEQTTSDTQGNLQSKRQFQNSSGVTGLMGQVKASNALQNLFNAQSSNQLQGQVAATSSQTLNTHLAGRVVQVLPNGTLVVEASRMIEMNNQKHLATVRGLVRPGDIAADNSVLSTQIADLQVSIKGKGVVSDGTRPPNVVVRTLLRVLNF